MELKLNNSGDFATQLERDLLLLHGPIMTGDCLRKALGYRSSAAFRQAIVRRSIPVPIFSIEKRRGKFALTKEVAQWVAAQRERTVPPVVEPDMGD